MTRPTGPDGRHAARRRAVTSDLGARVIDLADLEWCRSRLRSTTRGVLSARGPRRPVSLDVGLTMAGSEVVIAHDADPELLHSLAGLEVTLALTGHADDETRWVVRLTGVAELAAALTGSADLTAARQRHPAYGDGPAPDDTLLLPVYRLRGYHETALDEAADAPVR